MHVEYHTVQMWALLSRTTVRPLDIFLLFFSCRNGTVKSYYYYNDQFLLFIFFVAASVVRSRHVSSRHFAHFRIVIVVASTSSNCAHGAR